MCSSDKNNNIKLPSQDHDHQGEHQLETNCRNWADGFCFENHEISFTVSVHLALISPGR